jgi:hypothetical protein
MNVKKSMLMLGLILVISLGLIACGKNEKPKETLAPTTAPQGTQEQDTDTNEPEAEEPVQEEAAGNKVYVDFTFDDVEDGADVPNVASEGAGFMVVKDENGNGWAVSKNPEDWAAIFFGTPDETGTEVFLKDFCIETKVYLPTDNKGLSNDGGIPMFVSAEGRYDAALAWGAEASSINLWKAGNTDGGPIASNNKNEFPDRGWIADFSLESGKEYVYTIIGRYREDEDANQYVTLSMFIDDKLVLEYEVPYWAGGFGLRGWQSDIRYDYIKISDVPAVSPDGIAR